MLHHLLVEEGWRGTDADPDLADAEILYSENVYQKGIHKGGKDLWFWWRLQKQPEGKYNSYFMNHLEIDVHVVYLQNVEVIHQGKKITVQKGEIEIMLRSKMETDYQHHWAHHWLLKHFQKVFETKFVGPMLYKREKDLWQDAYKIQSRLKQYLNLRDYMAVSEGFFPKTYGWED